MVYSRLGLFSRFLVVIFSRMSNKFTPRVCSRSEEYTFLALQSFLLRICQLNSEPEYTDLLGSRRLNSSRSIPNSKIEHFSSSIMQKSQSFQGEQAMFEPNMQRFSQPMRQGSMILIVPSSKTRMFQEVRKTVLNCLRYGSSASALDSWTNQRALRQLQRILHKSSQLKYQVLSSLPSQIRTILLFLTQISVFRLMAEYQKMRCVLQVCVQKFSSFSSRICINLVTSMFQLILALYLRKCWSR